MEVESAGHVNQTAFVSEDTSAARRVKAGRRSQAAESWETEWPCRSLGQQLNLASSEHVLVACSTSLDSSLAEMWRVCAGQLKGWEEEEVEPPYH